MSEQQYQIVVRKGPQVGQIFPLQGSSLIVGRDPMNDIVINDLEISRQHARFTQLDDGYQIEDLGSTNGTAVNGERLGSEPRRLQSGSVINMGSGVRLVYEAVGLADANATLLVDEPGEWAEPEWVAEDRYTAVEPLPSPYVSDFLPPSSDSVLQSYAVPEPPPVDPPLVVPPQANSNSRRNLILIVVAVLLLCCCCLVFTALLLRSGELFENLRALELL